MSKKSVRCGLCRAIFAIGWPAILALNAICTIIIFVLHFTR